MRRFLRAGAVLAGSALQARHVLAQSNLTSDVGGYLLDGLNNSLATFPGGGIIGYGLNIFEIQPFDASTIEHALQTEHRLIKLKASDDEFDPGNGGPWKVPTNVACDKLSAVSRGSYTHYDNGIAAEAELSAGGGASASLKVVSGDASVDAGLKGSFNKDYQYGLYAFNAHNIDCGIEQWGDHVDTDYVTKRVLRLPRFKAEDASTIAAYQDFFNIHGTHAVIKVNLGSELSVSTWATNQDAELNAHFTSDVKAKFSGIEASGTADAHIKNEAQFRKFESYLGSATTCRGGDQSIAAAISENPEADDVADKLVAWIKTTDSSPVMIGVEIRSLSAVISDFDDANMRSYSKDLDAAYQYIVKNPEIHRTKVRMIINSDWGEVELLSPSAFIEEDPDFAKSKPPGYRISSTKVAWYGDIHARDTTIDFIIRNDGQPVDLHLDKGRDGPAGKGTGKIEVQVSSQPNNPLVYKEGTSTNRFNRVVMNSNGVRGQQQPQLQQLVSVAPNGAVLTGTLPDNSTDPSSHWVGGSQPGGGVNGQPYTSTTQAVNPNNNAGNVTEVSAGDQAVSSIAPRPAATAFATSKKQRRSSFFRRRQESASLAEAQ